MTDALVRLVEAAESYLSGLDHPGAAEVRAGIGRRRPAAEPPPPSPNPVIEAHLHEALAAVSGAPDLAEAIEAAAPALAWGVYDKYPPDEIGPGFREGHAYASIVGPHGAFEAGDFDLGLFLIAPRRLYRDHRHAAPELYAPLTGPHGWRFEPGAFLEWLPAHVPVWNPPHRPHATKVGVVPFLCLYVWTAAVSEAAVIVPADDWALIEG